MLRSLTVALLVTLLSGPPLAAQVLDQMLVPRGQLRLQAQPVFTLWDARFGRTDDGVEQQEELGDDLTDPTSLTLFPGIGTLAQLLESITGTSGYTPVLGSSAGRVTQDVTRIDFGGHLGVTDWLTIGAVVPWTRTNTAVDHIFTPDTLNGDLGLNPAFSNASAVDAFLLALSNADASAQNNATSICSSGPSAACTTAQSLAARTSAFSGSTRAAYAASAFFPVAGSVVAGSLSQMAAALDADLTGAGLTGIAAQMAFATQAASAADIALLPGMAGAGIEGASLTTRAGLWQVGDVEVTALVRLLDNSPRSGPPPAVGYQVTAGFLARLPTGTPEDPDVFLDIGSGDGQTDLEGSLAARFSLGSRFGLAVGGRYGVQGSTTLTRRVAPLEEALPAVTTRQVVTFNPGAYMALDVVPQFRLGDDLSVTAQYRFFHKKRDEFTLVDPTLPLDPTVLGRESGVKLHVAGVGLRYDTVATWLAGGGARPMQIHLRVVRAVAGGGGHVPVSTSVEAGIRLFKRFWGPRY